MLTVALGVVGVSLSFLGQAPVSSPVLVGQVATSSCPVANNSYTVSAPVFSVQAGASAFPTCDIVYAGLRQQMANWSFSWTQTATQKMQWIDRILKKAKVTPVQNRKTVQLLQTGNKVQKLTTYPLETIREQLRQSIRDALTPTVVVQFDPVLVNALTWPTGAVACRISAETVKSCTPVSGGTSSTTSVGASSQPGGATTGAATCTSQSLTANLKVRYAPGTLLNGYGANGVAIYQENPVYDVIIKNTGTSCTPAGKMEVTLTMSGLNAAGAMNSAQLTQVSRTNVTTTGCTIALGPQRNDGGRDSTLKCPIASLAAGASTTLTTAASTLPGPTCFNLQLLGKLMVTEGLSPQPLHWATASWYGPWPTPNCRNELQCGATCTPAPAPAP
jgi:hypothetical protein